MRTDALLPARWGFDAFGMAVGLAWVTAGLAVVVPSFQPLVAVLAAIAVAGAASTRAHARRDLPRDRRAVAAGIAGLGVASILWLSLPPSLGACRGLVLALGLLPLWWSVRSPGHRSFARRGLA